MATDFWASSHNKRWIVDRATVYQARIDDMQYVDDPEHLDFLGIYFANMISKLGRKLQFRQRVIATATVFFRRFYLKNSYSETDPFTVIAACCYLAAKAEESPVHIKSVVQESRTIFNQEDLNGRQWSTDNQKIAEMEFYLVDDLECDLVVFHPYRTLVALCKEVNHSPESGEEGETSDIGVGLDAGDGPRYWGTGEGQLELPPGALQVAWSIINDTYRSQLCILHPPHLIAIAAIYLSFIVHPPVRPEPQSATTEDEPEPFHRQPRRSSRQANNHYASQPKKPRPPQDPIAFLAELNVSLPLVATISQEIISLYALWDQYKEDVAPDATKLARELTGSSPAQSGSGVATGHGRHIKRSSSRSDSLGYASYYHSRSQSSVNTPGTDTNETLDTISSLQDSNRGATNGIYVTPVFLSTLMMRMREMKVADMAPTPPASASRSSGTGSVVGRKAVVNKRLERAQASG